jgi:dTDP-glucose pyrophosphorylase
MDRKRINERSIKPGEAVIFALKKMDQLGVKSLLLIGEGGVFAGLLSIGDIQRAIIRNIPLETPIERILRPNPRLAGPGLGADEIRRTMLKHRMECLPVVDGSGTLVDVHFWEDVFPPDTRRGEQKMNMPVVIMAGGQGVRLKPLTNVLPKALIPISEKTLIEDIMERFASYGCRDFFISVNYKADMIRYHFSGSRSPFNMEFIEERKPMGTAGSLSLLKGRIGQTFFVTNCDIVIDQDYSEIFDYHREQQNDITIVAVLKHYPIPYGTIESGEQGKLIELKEKPEITLKINSGMYILEPVVLDAIPENVFFHITQLIEKVRIQGGKVGVFPVSEGSWKDIGNWDEYLKWVR